MFPIRRQAKFIGSCPMLSALEHARFNLRTRPPTSTRSVLTGHYIGRQPIPIRESHLREPVPIYSYTAHSTKAEKRTEVDTISYSHRPISGCSVEYSRVLCLARNAKWHLSSRSLVRPSWLHIEAFHSFTAFQKSQRHQSNIYIQHTCGRGGGAFAFPLLVLHPFA